MGKSIYTVWLCKIVQWLSNVKLHIIIKSKVRYWKGTTTEVRSESLLAKKNDLNNPGISHLVVFVLLEDSHFSLWYTGYSYSKFLHQNFFKMWTMPAIVQWWHKAHRRVKVHFLCNCQTKPMAVKQHKLKLWNTKNGKYKNWDCKWKHLLVITILINRLVM